MRDRLDAALFGTVPISVAMNTGEYPMRPGHSLVRGGICGMPVN